MSQVREAIGHLNKVLESVGFSRCKPECFRQAKFNSNDVVKSFWKLLFEMIVYLDTGQINNTGTADFTDDVQVAYTKKSLQKKGYYSVEFSNLPHDMSTGSRELLLTLGWLLSTQRLLDKVLETSVSPLEMALPISDKVTESKFQTGHTKLSPMQKIQQLQLVNGKLHLTLKHLYSQHRAWCRFQHKVHLNTQGVSVCPGRDHLSVLEISMLRYSEQLKATIQRLEQENSTLNSMMAWKEQEHIFWKWMESVLHLKQEEMPANQVDEPKSAVHYNIKPQLLHRLGTSQKQLENSILKFESVIGQLEEIWDLKQTEIHKSDLQDLSKAVEAELACVKASIGNDSSFTNVHKQILGNPVFIFSKPSQKKGNSVFIPELHSADFDQGREPVDIELEIASLQTEVARLKLELEWKERFYQQTLDKLSTNIPNAVCIQPSGIQM